MHAVGKKAIPEVCKAHKIAYCPTMDLVALATEKRNLHVFRLSGQRVFGASFEDNDFDISWLKWKPDGAAASM
jgi:anaphase-promoting complex subunit 4